MLRHGDANPVNHPSLNYSTVHNALMFVSVNLKKQQPKKKTSFVWKVHPWGREKLLLSRDGFCEGDCEKCLKREVSN